MLNPVTPEFEALLRGLLPALAFKQDPAPYLTEPRGRWAGQGIVVAPADVDEVSAVVRACADARVPIVPYSGGTGLVGGSGVGMGSCAMRTLGLPRGGPGAPLHGVSVVGHGEAACVPRWAGAGCWP